MLMDSLVKSWRVALQSLIQARQTKGISTRDLAERLGISHEELVKIETMEVVPHLELVLDYAYELDQSIEMSVNEFSVAHLTHGDFKIEQAEVFGPRAITPFQVTNLDKKQGHFTYA